MTYVVCGPTRFHELDVEATSLAPVSEFRQQLGVLNRTWGTWGDPAEWAERQKSAARLKEMLGRPDATDYDILKIHWKLADWRPGLGIPVCSMINVGRIRPVEEAVAAGLTWSQECAKRMGTYDVEAKSRNPLELWTVAPSTGRYRAYKHILDCEVCWLEGVGKCELFPKIATLEIDGELDPALDPEHAA